MIMETFVQLMQLASLGAVIAGGMLSIWFSVVEGPGAG